MEQEMPKSVIWALALIGAGLLFYFWVWRPHHIDNGRIPKVDVTNTVTATPSR